MMCKRNIVFFQQQCGDCGRHSPRTTCFAPKMPLPVFRFFVATVTIVSMISVPPRTACGVDTTRGVEPLRHLDADPVEGDGGDRLWIISTRHLSTDVCRINLRAPRFDVRRLTCSGRQTRTSLEEYFRCVTQRRNAVIYVHGNRMRASDAVRRALIVYRNTRRCSDGQPIDWVVWSWPSEKRGIFIQDFRRKADRADAQGLYLSWMLRRHATAEVATGLIGYSFGARVVTGALHALAGGRLSGHVLPGPPTRGADFDAGLVAPAIGSHWLTRRGNHGLATHNLDQLLLMYNRRDAVLKRYWLLERVRGAMALGYSGPRSFGPRIDGSRLPVRALDCSPNIGTHHSEVDYYQKSSAGKEMASLIHDLDITH